MNRYEIRIHSLLDPAWQETFAVEALEHDVEQGQTLLLGPLDQAQLQRVLNRIHDMGLKLIAVRMMEREQ
ncbi:MAG: hypothetical protein AAF614_29885 [Chloroflexota bacterium]